MPPCTPDDCTIGLKLSSTVFRSGDSSADGETNPETGERLYFDRNGALIPYAAFKVLIQSEQMTVYMEQVKKQYEKDVGSDTWTEHEEEEQISAQVPQDEGEEEEDEENEPVKAKKSKKASKKKHLNNGGPKKVGIAQVGSAAEKGRLWVLSYIGKVTKKRKKGIA